MAGWDFGQTVKAGEGLFPVFVSSPGRAIFKAGMISGRGLLHATESPPDGKVLEKEKKLGAGNSGDETHEAYPRQKMNHTPLQFSAHKHCRAL